MLGLVLFLSLPYIKGSSWNQRTEGGSKMGRTFRSGEKKTQTFSPIDRASAEENGGQSQADETPAEPNTPQSDSQQTPEEASAPQSEEPSSSGEGQEGEVDDSHSDSDDPGGSVSQ